MPVIGLKLNGGNTVENIGFGDNVDVCIDDPSGVGYNRVTSCYNNVGAVFFQASAGNPAGNVIIGNNSPSGVIELAATDGSVVANNQVKDIYLTGCTRNIIGENRVYLSDTHGIHLNDSNDNQVSGNYVDSAGQTADDTYDGIYVDGNSDRNKVTENIVRYDPTTKSRYGINISAATCDENLVEGNDLLNSGATAEFNDAGTNTRGTQGLGGTVGADQVSSLVTRDAVFSEAGTLTTGVGNARLYNLSGVTRTIVGVYAGVGTAPTGADLIVDVNRGGTTIFTTQANRPTIAATTNVSALETPDVTTWGDGTYLTVDKDQVGSTVAGADLVVSVLWREQ
jgi:parallel beta-helix repeat protein